MYYIYVIQLNTGELYKGFTNNIDNRLIQHQKGEVRSTKNKLPFRLIHVELCDTKIKAREMEKFFKSGYGREIIKQIARVAK